MLSRLIVLFARFQSLSIFRPQGIAYIGVLAILATSATALGYDGSASESQKTRKAGTSKFSSSRSRDDIARQLPPAVEQALDWLPKDTETVVAAGQFEVPDVETESGPRGIEKLDVMKPARAGTFGGLFELEKSKYMKPLVGKRITLAMRGGRNFETVSSFGSHRSEGCAIIFFEETLTETSKDWLTLLREDADEVRTVRGRDVFVYPFAEVMEAKTEPKDWQGSYVVLLKKDVLLCAGSDRYLEELLERVDTSAERQALPHDLPEWKHLDPKASVWMIRHIPQEPQEPIINSKRQKPIISGLVGMIFEDQLRIVYLPVAGNAGAVETQARSKWIQEKAGLKCDIRREKDDTVVVSSTLRSVGAGGKMLITLFFYALQNESGAVGAQ